MPFFCCMFSLASYLLMQFSVNNRLAFEATHSRWRETIEGLLLSLVWPVLATSPWLFAVSWEPARGLLQTNALFPIFLLACHLAAAYPAYRYFYRTRLVELLRAGVAPVSFWPGQVPAAAAAARKSTPLLVTVSTQLDRLWQLRIEAMLEETGLKESLPLCQELRVTVAAEVPISTTIENAHPAWRPQAVPSMGQLLPFPHRDPRTACPEGIVQLDVECIRRRSGGMSSHYGYEGYFFSVLVQFPEGTVYDVRGEKAR